MFGLTVPAVQVNPWCWLAVSCGHCVNSHGNIFFSRFNKRESPNWRESSQNCTVFYFTVAEQGQSMILLVLEYFVLCCTVSSDCCPELLCVHVLSLPRPRHDLEKQSLLSQDCITNQTSRYLNSDLGEDMIFLPFSLSLGRLKGSSGQNWCYIASHPSSPILNDTLYWG